MRTLEIRVNSLDSLGDCLEELVVLNLGSGEEIAVGLVPDLDQ